MNGNATRSVQAIQFPPARAIGWASRQAVLVAAVVLFALPAHYTQRPMRAIRHRSVRPARTFETLGRYRFPAIAGWHRQETRDSVVAAVAYTRAVSGAQVTVTYTLLTTPPGTAPASEARLVRDLKTAAGALHQGARADHARVRLLRSQVTRFHGGPATVTLSRTSARTEVNDTRMLRFVSGGAEYWISVNVRGPARAWPAYRTASRLWERCRREAGAVPGTVVPR